MKMMTLTNEYCEITLYVDTTYRSADCRLFSPPQKRFDCTLNSAGAFILIMRG